MAVIDIASIELKLAKDSKKLKMIAAIYNILYVINGINYGFFVFRSARVKFVANGLILTVIISLTFIVMFQMYHDERKVTFYRYLICIVQYFSYVITFMLMNRDVTVSGCLTVFRHVDTVIGLDKASYNFEMMHLVLVVSCFMCKIAITPIYCNVFRVCMAGVWKNVFFFWLFVSHDLIAILNAFTFYLIKCRLVRLTQLLLENSEIDIVSLHRVYKSICNIAWKMKKAYDPVFKVTLLCSVPENMLFIYLRVLDTKKAELPPFWHLSVSGEFFVSVENILLTFAPAICADMVSSQVDEIKLVLHDKLLEEQDKSRALKILRFIQYIEARPLKFSIFKVIPLNARLPVMVLSFCVTYLIVVIQFTHLD